jgi:steroid 5-alpha reductase family enzyme
MPSTLLLVSGAGLLTSAAAMAVTAVVARSRGKVSVVDITWGLVFVAIAWVSYALGTGSWRSLLLAVLVTVWGGRLAWHIRRRAHGRGEDPRYEAMLSAAPEGRRFAYAVRKVFVVQGLAAWFVALPVQVAAATDEPLGWVAAIGVLVWLVGLTFEAVGDAQLARFTADPATRGTVMDRGLWAWTRHPNYFGDAAAWWGLWIVAAEAWPGVLTVLSPVAMTYFLAFATGARLLERHMAERPGYREYMERTSMFVPLPPKRHARPQGRG